MAVLIAGDILGVGAGIEDHDAHVADRNDGLRHRLDGREQAIDVPGALEQNLQLAAAEPAGREKLFRLLEIVVERLDAAQIGADLGRDDLAGRQRGAVMHRHDAEEIVIDGQHDRHEAVAIRDRLLHGVENALLLPAQGVAIDPLLGDDGELRGVDRIGALAKDLSLRSLLAAAHQEAARVLEVGFVLGVVGGEHLGRPERRAVAREHVGDASLADRDEIGLVEPIHEGHEDMNAAAQDLGLEARLAVQRNETRFDRALRRPHLLDDTDLIVGDVAKDVGHANQNEQQDDDCRPDADRDGVVEDRVHGGSLARAKPHLRWDGHSLPPDPTIAAGPIRSRSCRNANGRGERLALARISCGAAASAGFG